MDGPVGLRGFAPICRHDVVTQAYQHLLDRNPDPAGSIAWQTVLNFGGTDQYVYSGIAGTQEHFEKAQG